MSTAAAIGNRPVKMPFSPPFAAKREANGWSDRSPAPQLRRRRDGS